MDGKFLRFFQKISDWFQVRFHVNNFHLAKFTLSLSLFSSLSENVHSYFVEGKISTVMIISLIATIGITAVVWYNIIEGEWSCKNHTFTNVNVNDLQPFRLLILCASMVILPMGIAGSIKALEKSSHDFLVVFFIFLYRVTYPCALYFASCSPKPPSDVKKKPKEKFFSRFKLKPKLSTAKN